MYKIMYSSRENMWWLLHSESMGGCFRRYSFITSFKTKEDAETRKLELEKLEELK